jgi:hypothetical protein
MQCTHAHGIYKYYDLSYILISWMCSLTNNNSTNTQVNCQTKRTVHQYNEEQRTRNISLSEQFQNIINKIVETEAKSMPLIQTYI